MLMFSTSAENKAKLIIYARKKYVRLFLITKNRVYFF